MKANLNMNAEIPATALQGYAVTGAEFVSSDAAALEILRETGVDVIDAALVARAAIKAGRGRVRRAYECISAGEKALKKQEKTVTFERAVLEALEERKDRRKRTVTDFRYITRRFLRCCKGLAKRRVRSITAQECTEWIRQAFDTPRQRNKARLILSGVFSTAIMCGWCAENPVCKVQTERVEERRIKILNKGEIERLMGSAMVYRGGACLAAVAIMLLGGVRPHECERMVWKDIRLEEGVIVISPQHSKTGGARCVTIHPPLARILRRMQRGAQESICPPNWRRHWAVLHRVAGFTPWQADVLRHTFATHHLATFRSYAELQLEMGHRSADLLRTRYVAMEGVCSAPRLPMRGEGLFSMGCCLGSSGLFFDDKKSAPCGALG